MENEENKNVPPCPVCGSTKIKVLAYGLHAFSSKEAEQEFEKKYELGGCIIEPERYFCDECKWKF